jgi:DNA-binding transcriptional LysR family regulator
MPTPDLDDLDAFAAIVRAGGFRIAAARRGVSASTLSEALRRLEARLGVRLINRTTRAMTLTDAGAQLYERLAPALGEVSAALDAVNSFRDSPVGTLRLNVPTIVARAILPPLVTGFLREHPGVRMEVTADDAFIDILAAGFDAGVRYDERLERDMIAIPLGPRQQRFVVAGAPSYFAAHGRPKHPSDMLDHSVIRHRFASGVSHPLEFEKDGKVVRVVPEGRLVSNAIEMEIAAVIEGLGLIETFEDFLEPHLRSGALETVLGDWLPPFSGPFLYYHSRRHMPGPLRAFVDFLKRQPKS